MFAHSPTVCNVRVVSRFRPISSKEAAHAEDCTDSIQLNEEKHLVNISGQSDNRFVLDRVFGGHTEQQKVYEYALADTVQDVLQVSSHVTSLLRYANAGMHQQFTRVLQGFNGSVFAYGQTGSGKTHTMFGPAAGGLSRCVAASDPNAGLIPRAVSDVFQAIQRHDEDQLRKSSENERSQMQAKCSFLQIYQERVSDLVDPSLGELKVREHPKRGVYVEGARELTVKHEEHVMELISMGEQNRKVARTAMNDTSSRSHSILILNVYKEWGEGGNQRGQVKDQPEVSVAHQWLQLFMADLAGSEDVRKSKVQGEQFSEAAGINKSLSSLGNCINALTEKGRSHIPYRDSKLTWLMRDSLGGNAKTTLIVTCSPHETNLDETLSTLRFAERAKRIENAIKINKTRSVEELEALVAQLEEQLKRVSYSAR